MMLTRRETLLAAAGAAGALLLPSTAQARMIDYYPGLIDERLAAGDTVLADFAAHWCSTCRAQERALQRLRRDNPAYNSAITFIRVDWDTYRTAEITQRLRVPRRSTLILLRGEDELGRIVAGTGEGQIQELLDLGLA